MKRLGWIGVLALTLGCPSDDSGAGDGDEDTDAEDSTTTSGSTSSAEVGSASMTGASASMTSAGTVTSDSGMDSGSFISMDEGPDDSGEPGPLGAMCGSNEDCMSGFCYQVPMLGGVCSECLTDADCEFGCGVDLALGYAVCTDGTVGSMCEDENACGDGLVCAELIDTGGLFPLNFCSECATNKDCTDPDLCAPVYDVMNISGHLACVEPGSVGDGEGCPYADGMGDGSVCEHGHCGGASIFGVVTIGLCGNCSVNEDCMEGETCMPAMAGAGGVSGPMCG